jgi:hypothetical protein
MAKVKNQLAQLGMGTLVAGLKAVEKTLSRKDFKRVVATAVAQLLTTLPNYDQAKARRRARKLVGVKPVKKILVEAGKAGVKETLGTAAVAAASGAALKVASKVGKKITERVGEAAGVGASTSGAGPHRDDGNSDRRSDDTER